MIANNTKRCYNCTNYKFIIRLFEYCDNECVGFIQEKFMRELEEANKRDENEYRGVVGNKRKYKYFCTKVMNIFEAAHPSAAK